MVDQHPFVKNSTATMPRFPANDGIRLSHQFVANTSSHDNYSHSPVCSHCSARLRTPTLTAAL